MISLPFPPMEVASLRAVCQRCCTPPHNYESSERARIPGDKNKPSIEVLHLFRCSTHTLITPHHNYNSTLHPAAVDEVTTATIASIPANTTHNSNHLWVHQRIPPPTRDSQQPSSTIGFPILKLSPPPRAVLLVYNDNTPSSGTFPRRSAKAKNCFLRSLQYFNSYLKFKLVYHTPQLDLLADLT